MSDYMRNKTVAMYQSIRSLRKTLKRFVHNHPTLLKINAIRRRIIDVKRRKAASKYGVDTVTTVIDALETNGCEPFLTAGTLLGAIRDGRIMPYDDDIDIALRLEDNDEWDKVRSILEKAGFHLVREFSLEGHVREQAYQAKGFTFDVFGFHRANNGGTLRAYYFCRRDGEVYLDENDRSVMFRDLPDFKNRTVATLSGKPFPVPDNFEDVLTALYGPNWRVPDPNWKTGTGWELMDGVIIRRRIFE